MSKKRKGDSGSSGEKVDRRERSWTASDVRFRYVVAVSNDGLAFDKSCISFHDREVGQGFYDERSDRLQGASIFEAAATCSEIRGAFAASQTVEIVAWIHTLFPELAKASPPEVAAPDVAAPDVASPKVPSSPPRPHRSRPPQRVHRSARPAVPRREGWLAVALYASILLAMCAGLVIGGIGVIRSAAPLVRSAYRAQVDHAYRPVLATVIDRGTTSLAEARRARGRKYGIISARLGVRFSLSDEVREASVEIRVSDTAAQMLQFERTFGRLHEGGAIDVLVDEAYPLEPVLNEASLPGAGSLIGGLFGVLLGAFLVALIPGLLLLGFLPAKR